MSETGEEVLQVDYTIGFVTVPAGLDLEIDGITYATPIEFVWQEGEFHMIAAPSPQYDGDGTRYVWSTWSDFGARVHTIVVVGDENYTALYETQFRITIDTEPTGLGLMIGGMPTPVQFWLTSGEVTVVTAPAEVYVGNLTRYVFLHWVADPWIPVPLTDPTIMLTVTSPQNLTAVYQLQYCLFYDVPWWETLPTNCEWFDGGTTAYASLDSPFHYASPDTRLVFDHWGGDASGANYSQSDPILMDGPKTALTFWTKQYRLTFGDPSPMAGFTIIVDGVNYTTPATFWWEQGSTHTIEAPDQQAGPATRYKFAGWFNENCIGNPCILTVFMPGTYIPLWETQYFITVETVPSGLNFSLDSVDHTAPEGFWLDEGSVHLLETTSPQQPTAGTAYDWQSWSDGGGIAHDITVVAPETYTAYFGTQYEISFLGAAGLAVEVDNVSYTMPFSFWCDEGTSHSVFFPSPQAVGPQIQVGFLYWTDPSFLGNPATLVCDGPKSTSVVVETQYRVDLNTSPIGLNLSMDGIPYTAPVSFWWDADSPHYVYAPDYPPDCWWHHWSDGGEQGHDIVVTGPMTITAFYIFGAKITITTEPLVPVVEVDGVQYAPPAVFRWEFNTLHTINAPSPQLTPNGTLYFSHWSDGGAQSHTIVVNETGTHVAYYTGSVKVYVDTMPSPMQVYVDGVLYTTPQLFYWDLGSVHELEALEQQGGGPNEIFWFSHWSDGGDRYHEITIAGSDVYVAYYNRYYRIGVDTVPSGLNISANGTIYSTPASFWWKEGSAHELEAPSPQEHNGTRYHFLMWEDNFYFAKRTVVVSGPRTYVALYKPQHYLSVVIPEPPIPIIGPIVIGVGWYEDGSYAAPGLLVPELEYDNGWRKWVFLSWEGDAGGTDYRASEPILMDRSRTALVAWKAQFRVDVDSIPHGMTVEIDGTPTETPASLWVDLGDAVYLLAAEEPLAPGERYALSHWGGDGISELLEVVDAGRYVAFFSHQYYLSVESEHGSPTGGGWYDEGSLASVSIETEVSVGGNTYRFQGWSGHVSSNSSQVTVLMDSPALLVAHWSEVSEEPTGDLWPILYVATTAALVSVLIVAFYVLGIRPGRRGGSR